MNEHEPPPESTVRHKPVERDQPPSEPTIAHDLNRVHAPEAEPTITRQKPVTDQARPAPAPGSRRRKKKSLLDVIWRKLRLPRFGKWGTVVGLVGLVGGTIALTIVLAVTLKTMVSGDVFNPFKADDTVFTPVATPNPDFMAPTIDISQNQSFWQDRGPVTVLLLGTDARAWETGYRTRTDTIMLLMIDPAQQHAGMLSIPRDLYVELPGRGLERINTAYVYGGAGLAVDTVEYNFGIPVDYYVVVNFDVFVTLVDEIGGIDLNVPKEIYDTRYPDKYDGYDPFYIAAGMQHLDGETALKYARTRQTDNDYERARRQQAVIFAIREKVLRLDMLPTLITKAPTLSESLSESIRTDMTLEEMIELAEAALDIPEDNIRSGVIDHNYIIGHTTPEGSQVAIPQRDKVGELIRLVFWLTE